MLIIDQSISTYIYKNMESAKNTGESKRIIRRTLRTLPKREYLELTTKWPNLLL